MRYLVAILLSLSVFIAFSAGALYGRDHVRTERICTDPAHNDDGVWHCWQELK